ncbi:shikimate O-hydroxycinnamoyltransferase-like [Apium graveolens]|uniref:shikimate O-hydroxycinnamoyltransferase-like n=1 Tax=Apium graveolens TaxID=4045 RepID=UPI003D7B95C2
MVSEKMKITVKESSMVYPSKPTPSKKLWNSNLDLVVAKIHILTVYFYKPNGACNFFESRILRESLSNVLVCFFPMAGRLSKDEKGRVEIDCNARGALFVDAEAEFTSLDDFGDFRPSHELRRLVPAVDYSGDVSSYPLVVAQMTRFKCGGVCLGLGIHHTLADGLAGLHFINTWSDVARGLSVAMPPFIDRTLLRARDPPTPTFDHVEYHSPPSLNTRKNSSTNNVSTTVLKLTLDQLNKLKSSAKTDGNSKDHSTYEILAAHLWRCATKARGLSDDQMTKLFVATDGRSRLCPPLPPGYVGNVVFTATPLSAAGALTLEPLTDSCNRIHNCLAKMDNEYLRSALDHLQLQPDLSALVRGPQYFANPNLNINSWVRLPIYDSDFGWGRPIHMGPASILYEGTIYILPSPKNDRSMTLSVCLEASHIELFKKFLYDF